MYFHRPPPEDSPEMQAYRRATAAFHDYASAVGPHRTDAQQAEVDRLYSELHRTEHWYYRLNIWGMGEARDELEPVGVIYADYSEMPSWPDIPDDASDEEVEAATADTLRWRPPGEYPGIPVHKLCDNSGWHVTPGEIQTGVGWADAHHDGWREDLTDYVLEFVEWMERAARDGDGFRVY
jgi:hypothetical protein